MFFYLARQPILTRERSLYGYELLFRDGENNAFPNIDDDVATSKLIQNSQFQHTLGELTEHKLAFINFAEGGLLSSLPELLDPADIVVEILESVRPSDAVKAKIRSLKAAGYRIALDDYNFDPGWQELFPCIDIIKVDLLAYTHRKLQILKYQIRDFDIQLLAEKVETETQFNDAIEDGFVYFQGYFFARPEMLKRRTLNPTKAACTELLAETARSDFDFRRMTIILQQDVALSYRLLRFVNAAAFGLRQKVTSLQQAVVFLGADEVNRFVTMAVTAALNDDKPNELIRMAIIRARFCELLAEYDSRQTDGHQAFLVGLFSLLDAMFDENMEDALNRLNLSTNIVDALLHRRGVLAFYVGIIQLYENAEWERVERIASRLKVDHEKVAELYLQATEWAKQIVLLDED